MPKHPLAEVFGFPIDNQSAEAVRHRQHRLCPFNNKVPNCTKDKASDPLGVCSVYEGGNTAITCPVRFREGWVIAEQAAEFFFPENVKWTSLTEVRLNDRHGRSAGNIDVVLVAYNEQGKIIDFGALEIQAVYISGNIRRPFEHFMKDMAGGARMDWTNQPNYPRPDYLSSSRKRLAPQLIFKGGILKGWGKKQAVAIHQGFYNTLPKLTEVAPEQADIAWMIYDLKRDTERDIYHLSYDRTAYTQFEAALTRITTAEAGPVNSFIEYLQEKLDEKLDGNPPDAPTLADALLA
jgi:hypothetical protein